VKITKNQNSQILLSQQNFYKKQKFSIIEGPLTLKPILVTSATPYRCMDWVESYFPCFRHPALV